MLASGYARNEHDWYQESRECVDFLLDKETFTGDSWDPACGEGNIPEALLARGIDCFGSDICDRGYGLTNTDFFQAEFHVDNIVSNPPYNVLQEFVERALTLSRRKVAVIAPLSFLESKRREQFFDITPLRKVYTSRKRISMPPGGKGIVARGGIKAYAWFVWEQGYVGEPRLGWI